MNLKKSLMIVPAAALVLTGAAGFAQQSNAQQPKQNQSAQGPRMAGFHVLLEAAKFLGVTPMELNVLSGGTKSLSDVAKGLGADVAKLEAALVAARNASIDEALKAKRITETEASSMKATSGSVVKAALAAPVQAGFGGRGGPAGNDRGGDRQGPGGNAGRQGNNQGQRGGTQQNQPKQNGTDNTRGPRAAGANLYVAAAKFLGVTPMELGTLSGGTKSLTDVAKGLGADLAKLEAALVTARNTGIDEAVKAKRISEEQGKTAKAQSATVVKALLAAPVQAGRGAGGPRR